MLAVPRYNKPMLKGKGSEVKAALSQFSHPHNRRIAGAHGTFSTRGHKKWLRNAGIDDLAPALRRFAQLNQEKVYLLWERADRKS